MQSKPGTNKLSKRRQSPCSCLLHEGPLHLSGSSLASSHVTIAHHLAHSLLGEDDSRRAALVFCGVYYPSPLFRIPRLLHPGKAVVAMEADKEAHGTELWKLRGGGRRNPAVRTLVHLVPSGSDTGLDVGHARTASTSTAQGYWSYSFHSGLTPLGPLDPFGRTAGPCV